jgi:hypothetical protein
VSNPIDAKKLRCQRRFLRYFPNGFSDERYLAWERDYKAEAHALWKAKLSGRRFAEFLAAGQYDEGPTWTTYAELLDLAALVRLDQRDLGPRDFIDAQSFLGARL